MRIALAVLLVLVALAALFFVVAGVVITISGIRTRRGVKGDIALTGFFLVCFVLAAGGGVLVALPGTTEQAGPQGGQQREKPDPGQPQAASGTGEDTVARSGPAATPDPSLAFDCKDFTSQGAAQKALDQGLEDQDALDPDADGDACEALADPDPGPKPDPEKEPEPERKSESEKKSASDKDSASENRSAPEKEPEPEKSR